MNRGTWERLRVGFNVMHQDVPTFTIGPICGVWGIEYPGSPERMADTTNGLTLMTIAGQRLESIPDALLLPGARAQCHRIRAETGFARWLEWIFHVHAVHLERYREMSVGEASVIAIDQLLLRWDNQAAATDHADDDMRPLSDAEQAVLKALAINPGVLKSLQDVKMLLKSPSIRFPLSHNTVIKIVNRLIDFGFAHRPKTINKGVALTLKGQQTIEKRDQDAATRTGRRNRSHAM